MTTVRQENHESEGFPLCMFLYDEKSRSVYSGRHIVSSQGSRPRRSRSAMVLVTSFYPPITDKGLKHALQSLVDRRRRVEIIKCLHNEGIAFVQFARYKDALGVVEMKHILVPFESSGMPTARENGKELQKMICLRHTTALRQVMAISTTSTPERKLMRFHCGDCDEERTSRYLATTLSSEFDPLFLYEDPGHESATYTDNDSGGSPTPLHEQPPVDAQCLSVEFHPLEAYTTHGKADTLTADTHPEEVQDRRSQAECEPQSDAEYDEQTALTQSHFQSLSHRVEAVVSSKAEIKAELEVELEAAMKAEMKAELQAELKAEMQAQMKAQMEAEMEGKLQALAAHFQTQMEKQLQTRKQQMSQLRSEVNKLSKGITESEVRVKLEISLLQSQINSRITKPENQIRSAYSQLMTELMSEMDELKLAVSQSTPEMNQLRADVTQLQTLTSDVTQSQSQLQSQAKHLANKIAQMEIQTRREIEQFQNQTRDQLQECVESNARTQSSLEMSERMQTRMIADAQASVASQTRAEIVTLKGEIRALRNQLPEIRRQPTNQTSTMTRQMGVPSHNLRQLGPDREETDSVITVVNASDSASSANTSNTPS
ncbi:hypothetical protein BaRGS_00035964 [Batillaria attramentaria]|uniref:RRM domain-containing protein n=1 Tax=Batillaria attramentaria TaxID=370345 RepID=A0ABD0JD02_9CAEN